MDRLQLTIYMKMTSQRLTLTFKNVTENYGHSCRIVLDKVASRLHNGTKYMEK